MKLRPYRTFKEIDQPESQFLLRLNENGNIGLFEADGGMWKLEAKKSIAILIVYLIDFHLFPPVLHLIQ